MNSDFGVVQSCAKVAMVSGVDVDSGTGKRAEKFDDIDERFPERDFAGVPENLLFPEGSVDEGLERTE
jgi:hypothetical protein